MFVAASNCCSQRLWQLLGAQRGRGPAPHHPLDAEAAEEDAARQQEALQLRGEGRREKGVCYSAGSRASKRAGWCQ